jgi:hypothetical protein
MKIIAIFQRRRDGSFGSVFGHQIEADGSVEVSESEAEHLLGTGNFIDPEAKPGQISSGSGAAEMIITNGEDTINLLDLDKPELLAMAIDMELEVTGRNSAQTIRDAIFAHVNQ